MKNFLKKVISNKLYIGCLILIFIFYIFGINKVKESLFHTISELTMTQYGLLVVAILGATIFAGTLLFGVLRAQIFIIKRVWRIFTKISD
ncbi:MAG: hypothetical protein AB6733_24435 [Clostridiaceae bacterium]